MSCLLITDHSIEERRDIASGSRGHQSSTHRIADHLFILPSFAIVLVVLAWFVTCGDWRFFRHEPYKTFYDSQARSILHGHLDVTSEAIGDEAFIRDGKLYGYFGITPALFRIPLDLMFPGLAGRWGRCMMLLASTFGLLQAYRILALVAWPRNGEPCGRGRKLLFSLFILAIGIGSSNLFMTCHSHMFHEAITWGSALSLAFCYYLLRYLREGSARLLPIAGAFCFFAFLSRATAGAGAVLALLILCVVFLVRSFRAREYAQHAATASLRPAVLRLHAAAAAIAVAVTLACHFGITYAKFRTFEAVPVRMYQQYILRPQRMKATAGKQIHLSNLRAGLYNYFGFGGMFILGRSFPWFFMTDRALIFPETVIDDIEPFCGIPVSAPALFALGILGLCGIATGKKPELRRMRLPVLAMWAGGTVVLVTVGITERYVHDFFPLLVLCAVAGIARLAEMRLLHMRIGIALLTLLVLFSVAINGAFAVMEIPETPRQEYCGWLDTLDKCLHSHTLAGRSVNL